MKAEVQCTQGSGSCLRLCNSSSRPESLKCVVTERSKSQLDLERKEMKNICHGRNRNVFSKLFNVESVNSLFLFNLIAKNMLKELCNFCF